MSQWTLYLGNRNYSSWSMRAWLAMRRTGIAFEEVRFHLGEPGVRERIRRHSPSGRVPALRHGERVVWDSLAICEYLAEHAPQAGLWPDDRDARAHARSVVAEMHAGFPAIRERMPFNVRRSSPGKGKGPGVEDEIRRICDIWISCRDAFGAGGSFLFGGFGIADAFFAPVVSRFRTYAVETGASCEAYAEAVWRHPLVEEWRADAESESWVEPQFDL